MAILNKEELFHKVVKAIKRNGWEIKTKSDILQQPVRLEIFKNDISQLLRVYIWNLSHGGKGRAENEFRIQVKVNRFEEESNSKALILGYWDDKDVFAGFDIRKHIGQPAWSASMQIKKEILEQAINAKVAAHKKDNGEIVVAFRPDFFIDYVNDSSEIHSTGNLQKYFSYDQKTEVEDIEDDTENEVVQFRYSITSYGADYPVDSIVKRVDSNAIFLPPFQRKFVWNIKEASRFIESLILGLPVPGIFLSKEEGTNRLLIVDGQQRIYSLYSFYENNFKNKTFKLIGVQQDLEGLTYADLNSSDKLRLDDSIIHATIIKQEEPDDNESSIYTIFERLNSSGKILTPQEIRACIYYGEFNEYLNKLVLEKNWRDVFGKMNERLKEQELLLRFFALYYNLSEYQKPLKSFLNGFMNSNRNLTKYKSEQLDSVIQSLIGYINQSLGNKAFRLGRGINAALFDSIMIGVSKRIEKGSLPDQAAFLTAYEELLKEDSFTILVKEGTSDENTVKKRIEISIDKFDSI